MSWKHCATLHLMACALASCIVGSAMADDDRPTPRLLIPVAGVLPSQLRDTFHERRGNAAHEALDIPAARGTPVVAVDDGRVVKLFRSVPGGITVYQADARDEVVYYYAHLDRYADGLQKASR